MPFVRFLVYTNIWIALAAGTLTLSSSALFSQNDFHRNLNPAGFAFFGTLAGYNWLRWLSLKFGNRNTRNERLTWLSTRKKLLWLFIFIGGGGVLALVPSLSWKQTAIASITFVILAFYGIPIAALKKKAIRQIPFLKIFLISLSWAAVTVAIPLADERLPLNTFTLFFIAQTLFIFALTIPFDIRDMQIDVPNNFTIAQRLGVKRAKLLSILCMPMTALCYLNLPLLTTETIALICSIMVTIPLLAMANVNRKDLYYTGFIDGLMILQGGIILIISA
jgi:hypothetical protein